MHPSLLPLILKEFYQKENLFYVDFCGKELMMDNDFNLYLITSLLPAKIARDFREKVFGKRLIVAVGWSCSVSFAGVFNKFRPRR